MTIDPLGEMIRRVLRDAPFAMRQLAADAGLSYDVLRSWRSGRRRPSRSSAQRLAAGLEARGERLLVLARELRATTQDRVEDEGRAPGADTAPGEGRAAGDDGAPAEGSGLAAAGRGEG